MKYLINSVIRSTNFIFIRNENMKTRRILRPFATVQEQFSYYRATAVWYQVG